MELMVGQPRVRRGRGVPPSKRRGIALGFRLYWLVVGALDEVLHFELGGTAFRVVRASTLLLLQLLPVKMVTTRVVGVLNPPPPRHRPIRRVRDQAVGRVPGRVLGGCGARGRGLRREATGGAFRGGDNDNMVYMTFDGSHAKTHTVSFFQIQRRESTAGRRRRTGSS